MARVLLLAKLTPQSGNKTTAERIRSHLMETGNVCLLESTTSFENEVELSKYLADQMVQCVLGIHLWRAGRFLLDSSVAFCVIFGGTDIYEHVKEPYKLKVMTKVVKQAKCLVAFSDVMASKAKEIWPDIRSKVIVQCQAVSTNPSAFSELDMINKMKECASLEEKACLENLPEGSLVLFVLVAGLRPVKDPMFLFQAISEWHREDPRVFMIVLGPELDPEYAREVKCCAKSFPGVLVIPPLEQDDLHGAIKSCAAAVVNSSLSEGMASSLLEAMDLGTAVVARRVPGNESLIKHKENGLLFDSPEEFLSLMKKVVSSKELLDHLTLFGKRYIAKNHSMDDEKDTYHSIIKTLTPQTQTLDDAQLQ